MNIKGIINNRTSAMMQQREHEIHMRRLQSMKPIVNTRKPRTPNHLAFNAKKELYFEFLKKKDINNANKILVKRMVKIDENEGKLNPRSLLQARMPSNPSLNFKIREQEQLRILNDNRKIVRHIHRAKSYYPKEEILRKTRFNQYLGQKMSEASNRFERNRFFLNMMGNSPSAASMMNITLEPNSYRQPLADKSALLPSSPLSPSDRIPSKKRPVSAPKQKQKRVMTAPGSHRKPMMKQSLKRDDPQMKSGHSESPCPSSPKQSAREQQPMQIIAASKENTELPPHRDNPDLQL